MKTINVQVFTIEELSPALQEKAYQAWASHDDYAFHGDNEATLTAFTNLFNVYIHDFEYGGYSAPYIRFNITNEDQEDLRGLRLATYIHNNFYPYITKGRYYSLWSKTDKNPHYRESGHAPYGALKSRHSKVLTQTRGTCVFTGYYMDDVILEPLWDFLENPSKHTTYRSLVRKCLNAWVNACHDDCFASRTMEAFIDHAAANEYEYTANGKQFYA